MNVVTLGVHMVDVLVRPVEQIPDGQGGTLVEQIRITPAGPAGGTAVTLAKLGASVCTPARSAPTSWATRCASCSTATGSTARCSSAVRESRPRQACCRSAPTARAPRCT